MEKVGLKQFRRSLFRLSKKMKKLFKLTQFNEFL